MSRHGVYKDISDVHLAETQVRCEENPKQLLMVCVCVIYSMCMIYVLCVYSVYICSVFLCV